MSISTVSVEAQQVLKEALRELESPKGRVQAGVQKLIRAARMLGEDDVAVWCEIQLGNAKYVGHLRSAVNSDAFEYYFLDNDVRKAVQELVGNRPPKKGRQKPAEKEKRTDWEKKVKEGESYVKALTSLGLKPEVHYTREERLIKANKAGGGYSSIGTIEDILAGLHRKKLGNDGTHYQNTLTAHINYVRRVAHEKASKLYSKVVFSSTPQTSLDILRSEVDTRLLDLVPEATEKLMVAFRSVANNHPEDWSHALTSCRRFIENLADALYPATDVEIKGRKLGQAQYINRLWAFMDGSIDSNTNRDLAKAHVDYLGSYLERVHKIGNKGVHADLSRTEAIKAVLHTYLLVADILDYLGQGEKQKPRQLNINTATLDELESMLEINRTVAKEIIKLRVARGVLDPTSLAKIKGIGPKTIAVAEKVLSFDAIK